MFGILWVGIGYTGSSILWVIIDYIGIDIIYDGPNCTGIGVLKLSLILSMPRENYV